MAWSEAARKASLEARRRRKANKGVDVVGKLLSTLDRNPGARTELHATGQLPKALRGRASPSKTASLISRNLGGPRKLTLEKAVSPQRLTATIRMNLTPGGYAAAIYRARLRNLGK